jgi:hypothetical protein
MRGLEGLPAVAAMRVVEWGGGVEGPGSGRECEYYIRCYDLSAAPSLHSFSFLASSWHIIGALALRGMDRFPSLRQSIDDLRDLRGIPPQAINALCAL